MMIEIERKLKKNSNTQAIFPYFFVCVLLFQQIFVTNCYEKGNLASNHGNAEGEFAAVDKVEIPYPVLAGQTVQLRCHWRARSYYSIRWYKDDIQIYSNFHGGAGKNSNDREGIKVNTEESDEHVVTLNAITPRAEGIYKCELMTVGPRFRVAFAVANLTVVKRSEVPQILGLRERYLVGDTLNVTCKAMNGRPAPQITFQINNEQIQEGSGRLTENPHTRGDQEGLFTSEARLVMPLSERLLHEFNLSCHAYTNGLSVETQVRVPLSPRKTVLISTSGKETANLYMVSTSMLVIFAFCVLLLKYF